MSIPTPEQIKQSPAVYMSRVHSALRHRQRDEEQWRKCYATYEDKNKPCNLVTPSVDRRLDKILSNPPKFVLHPSFATATVSTPIATQDYSNTVWHRYGLFAEFQHAGRDCLICGHGWVKASWRQATDGVTTTASYPELERIDPVDIVVSPEATNMQNVSWMCHHQHSELSDVLSDDRYNERARHRLGEIASQTASSAESESDIDTPVTIWEMWSIEDNLVAVWADGTDEWLIDPRPFPSTGHPFVLLEDRFTVPHLFYSPSNTSNLLSIQNAIYRIEAMTPSQGATDDLMAILMNDFQLVSGEHPLMLQALGRSFEEAAAEINRKIVQLAQHHLTIAELIDNDDYTGKATPTSEVTIEKLRSEHDHLFRLEVEAGSMSAETVNIEEWLQFIAALKPFVKMDIINTEKLCEYLKSKGIANPEDLLGG